MTTNAPQQEKPALKPVTMKDMQPFASAGCDRCHGRGYKFYRARVVQKLEGDMPATPKRRNGYRYTPPPKKDRPRVKSEVIDNSAVACRCACEAIMKAHPEIIVDGSGNMWWPVSNS